MTKKNKLAQSKFIALRIDENDRRIMQAVSQRTGITAGSTILRYVLREYARMAGITTENAPVNAAMPAHEGSAS